MEFLAKYERQSIRFIWPDIPQLQLMLLLLHDNSARQFTLCPFTKTRIFMALTSTMYNFEIELSDIDRGVYTAIKCGMAMHPSETIDFMVTRLLAYCLEYTDGISFSKGLSDAEEPAVWVKHLDGRIQTWIEVGRPAADRLHRASKQVNRLVVYTHKPAGVFLKQLENKRIHNRELIPIYSFNATFHNEIANLLERRNQLAISVSDREIYLEISGHHLTTPVNEHRMHAL